MRRARIRPAQVRRLPRLSRQIQAIFKDYTPLVEPPSLDEAYLDVTDNLKGIPTAWETAKEIRARIYEETNSPLRPEFPAISSLRSLRPIIGSQRSVRHHARRS